MNLESERRKIQASIKEKYAEVSKSAVGKFAYSTGMEGARILGYDEAILSRLSPQLMKSFCGVGNPFRDSMIAAGDAVLDVGCGSGIDLIIAAWLSGKTGRICGIDITPEMRRLARTNATALGLNNVEVREGAAESIPYEDGAFNVVISNGVLNLSPEKGRAFHEIFRVLAPGGRLQFADIVLEGDQPRAKSYTLESWSD